MSSAPSTNTTAANGATAPESEKAQSADLGIAERRKFIRPLPVPVVVESQGDTDWATFQALLSDKP
jgi:hypothetical protein